MADITAPFPVNGQEPWGNDLRAWGTQVADVINTGRLSEASLNGAYATAAQGAKADAAVPATLRGAEDVATKQLAGLRTFHNALMHRATTPVDILTIGDSFMEGVGTVSVAKDMLSVLRDKLRTDYPTSITGGHGSLSGVAFWNPADKFWTANVQTVRNDYGPSLRAWQMNATGQKVTITIDSTGFDIHWFRNTSQGTFYWKVDGGSATNVSTAGTLAYGRTTSITGLTAGSHTLEVGWVSGSFVIEDVMIYNGDAAAGIRTRRFGRGSTQTADWANNARWDAAIAATVPTPALVFICLGANDWAGTGYTPIASATTKTNLQSIITKIRAACTNSPSICLVTQYQKQGSGLTNAIEPWSNYVAAIQQVLDADSTLIGFDMSKRFGTLPTVDAGGSTFVTDSVHPNDTGQEMWARALASFLAPA